MNSKNKKIIATIVTAIAVVTSVVISTLANDINLDPSIKYGTLIYPKTMIGTQLDPIVIDAHGASIECVQLLGQWIEFKNAIVTGCVQHGIYADGQNITIENNEVYNTARSNATSDTVNCLQPNSGWGSAIKVRVGGENINIRGNKVHDNCGEGIATTRGKNVLIENNIVYDNFGVNIYIDNSPFTVVRKNISYATGLSHLRNGNRPTGIAMGEEYYSGWGAQLHDIEIYGNIITDCGSGISAYASNVDGILTNIKIDNNNIPSGIKRSISIQTVENKNVVISNNQIFGEMWIYNIAGVTLINNTIGTPVPSTPTPTPTSTRTSTSTPTTTPTVTSTPTSTNTPTPTLTPIHTPTSTPQLLCVRVTWNKVLNVRHSPSMYNLSYLVNISPNALVPVEGIIENPEGTWGVINDRMYFAMFLKSNNRTYAVKEICK